MNYDRAQSEEQLLKRFPDGKIPFYWRTGELAKILDRDTSTIRVMCKTFEIPRFRYSGTTKFGESTREAIILCEDVVKKLLDDQVSETLFETYGGLRTLFLGIYRVRHPESFASRMEQFNNSEDHIDFRPKFDLVSESRLFVSHLRTKLEQLVKKCTSKYPVDEVPHSIERLYRENEARCSALVAATEADETLREVVSIVKIYMSINFEDVRDMCKRIELELEPSNSKDTV